MTRRPRLGRPVVFAAMIAVSVASITLGASTGASADSPPTVLNSTTPGSPGTSTPGVGSTGPVTSATTSTSTTSTTSAPLTTSSTTSTPVEASNAAPAAQGAASLIGSGSSFAGPEVLQWTTDTAKPPYNLSVNFTPSSSGQGRFDFGSDTVDFAVSDIPYQGVAFDTKQPNFPFIYVPVTAGGLALMYHLNGMPSGKTLQLSSYSICALMTGGVTKWNDPIIQADNPGVALPSTQIRPVIREDLAGTNFVLQEYCLHEQPALWKAFIDATTTQQYPGQVGDLSDSQPRSDWPVFAGAIEANGSANAADDVARPEDDGYITAVETAYAIQRNFPVASVKNASGVYNQPGAVNVASALAYATQNPNGTHTLNFDGTGPHVYNPSTYSYLLTPTTGWSATKGATMSQFVNYSLTLGQEKAPEIGYASLGLSLEQFGVNSVKVAVPGAVALTSTEQNAYQCGDLTPSEVQAGQTQPTCGVTNPNNTSIPGTTAANSATTHTTTGGTATKAKTGPSTAARTGTSGSGGVDPSVGLPGSPSLPTTGGAPYPVIIAGVLFVVVGWLARRRLLARLR